MTAPSSILRVDNFRRGSYVHLARGKIPISGYSLPFAICQRPQIELCQLIEFDVDLTWIYALMQLPRKRRYNQILAENSFPFLGDF